MLLSPSNSFSLYLSPLGMKLKLFFRNLFNQMESKASLGPQISLWASSLYLGWGVHFSFPRTLFTSCQSSLLSVLSFVHVWAPSYCYALKTEACFTYTYSEDPPQNSVAAQPELLRLKVFSLRGTQGLRGRVCINGWGCCYPSIGWMTSPMGTMLNYHLDLLCSA